MLPTHARAHAHTCPHTRTDPEFGFLYFFGVSMCGVAAPAWWGSCSPTHARTHTHTRTRPRAYACVRTLAAHL